MLLSDGNLLVSATDLAGHLACRHLTHLERAATKGQAARPNSWDPLLQLLWERGARFEREYLDHLSASGLRVQQIEGTGVEPGAAAETLAAMRAGVHVIAQGALAMGRWRGRADILLRVETPSDLGPWSYEPADTKLARETRAGAILQLCAYAEMLAAMQGGAPECFHVVAPGDGFETCTYRFADFAAYHRQAKRGMEAALLDNATEPYPEPVERCDVSRLANPLQHPPACRRSPLLGRRHQQDPARRTAATGGDDPGLPRDYARSPDMEARPRCHVVL